MSERLIEKLDRLGEEAGITAMTPELRRFAMLVRADLVAEQPARYATTIGEGNLSANGFEGDWFKKPAQPSKPWVGLTDMERAEVQYEAHKKGLTPLEFMELHEAKMREKNNG